jgi:predicted dehydrogenase
MTSETHKTKVGVIGAGWWATFAHIPALKNHEGAELIAVQSRDHAKAEKIARDFDVRHACTSVEELLDVPGLEAVVVSSTPNMHYTQAKAALARGLHVLIEKPMTFTAAEARELVDLASSRQVQLLISCPWHYTAHGIEARKRIAAGELGRIKMISLLMTNPIDKLLRGINTSPTHGMDQVYVEPRLGSYNDPAIAGGGQIYCQVSHAAAYLAFLTGLRPAEVFARFDHDGTVNDIYDALTIRMENGALVSLASTAATPLCERAYEVRVFGDKGVMMLELWQGTMSMACFDGQTHEFPPLDADAIYPAQSPALNFIDAIRGIAPNGSPGDLGLASMEIIDAACRSADGAGNIILRPVS